MITEDGSIPPAVQASEEPTNTPTPELEVHDNDSAHFLARALEIKDQIEARSRGKLGVNSEVVVALESIPRVIGEDLVRLAVRRARTHPNDNYVLMEDVHWARRRLVSGTGSSPLPLTFTTLGGLLFGVGAPMLIGAMVADKGMVISPATIGWGSGCTVVGAALLAMGLALAARRS